MKKDKEKNPTPAQPETGGGIQDDRPKAGHGKTEPEASSILEIC